jgi:cell division protein FtsW (lipid II flippase)
MNISTLQMLALMAIGVAVIVGITIATTSRSRLVKAGGYVFTAVLIVAVAIAMFLTPTEDPDTAQGQIITGFLLLAAAGWVGLNAIRAYRRK